MDNGSNDKTDFCLQLVLETAKRRQFLVTAEIDLAAFGERPRIGQILDRLGGRNSAASSAVNVQVGPYLFDSANLTLTEGARTIRLTEKERDILVALLQAPDRRIGRRDMLGKVWGYASGVETHTLETHVYRLRQKLESDPARPVLLLTDGDGYALA